VCFILSAAVAQNTLQPGEGDLDVATGYVWADIITDGTTVITFGDISSDTLELTRSLSAGFTTLNDLHLTSAEVADLWAYTLHTDSLTNGGLNVFSPAMFESDVTISGNLMAGQSSFGNTRASTLMVKGTANFESAVFAQRAVQVDGDLNSGGNARVFGPAVADVNVNIEDMLTVAGSAAAANWNVKELTQTMNLMANQTDSRYLWAQQLQVGGDLNVVGNITAGGALTVAKQVNAKSLDTAQAVTVGKNVTVSGWLTGQSATVTNFTNLAGWEIVHGSLNVNGFASSASNFSTNGTFSVTGNLTGDADVLGVNAVFTNLMVDRSTIESLTSTSVTATTLNAETASVKNTFVVTGASTITELRVLGNTDFNDVKFVMLTTTDLGATDATTVNLNNTGSATLTTVEVKTLLTSGSPNLINPVSTAIFQNTYVDDLTAVNFFGTHANIAALDGTSFTYDNLTGFNADLTDFTSVNAWITVAAIDNAVITDLVGVWANVTHVTATAVDTMNVTSDLADLMDLSSVDITTVRLDANSGDITSLKAENITTNVFDAANGNFTDLRSMNAMITTLSVTNSTITNLNSASANTTWLWGKNLTYNTGSIQNVLSNQHMGGNAMLNGFDTQILYANTYANLSDTTSSTLKVTGSSWFSQNATVRQDLFVEGFSALQEGIIAGDSVIAALTVVGDTVTSSVSVTGLAFLTDLEVKKMTITDSFESASATITNATVSALRVTSNLTVNGRLAVQGDSRLGGNLVVQGTTQFQTGSFSRIGTALLTTTDMEAFNINVASGIFGALTVDDLEVNRAANFQRSIELVGMLSSTSGSPYSVFSSIRPSTLTAVSDGKTITVEAATVLHTGQSTVDALVFTAANDSTVATLRVTGDGYLDFMGGELNFESLSVADGIEFENENNVAWVRGSAIPSTNLARGAQAPVYVYADMIDRDLQLPGQAFTVTRFGQPGNQQDLITLQPGHYRVTGNIYFTFNSAATASARVIARAGIDGYMGTSSTGNPRVWQTDCAANFQSIAGAVHGGSCFFDGVVIVQTGSVYTLRSFAEFSFASATLGNTLRVDPSSTILVEELFERTSESFN